jgi:hypothetical protein
MTSGELAGRFSHAWPTRGLADLYLAAATATSMRTVAAAAIGY